MRRALAIALVTAGCFSDRGLAIEVEIGKADVTSVELFVGNARCDPSDNAAGIPCNGIRPIGVDRRLDGEIYFRADIAAYTAEVHGGKATFRLEAEADTTLPVVVLVGTNSGQAKGAATLHDVLVPGDGSKLVTTTLAGADLITTTSTTADMTERFQVWANPAERRHTCLAIEHWANGGVMREFVVPEDDPDCDDVVDAALECDGEVYNSQHPAPDTTPSCFTAMPSAACLLGAESCIDGMGRTGMCDPFAAQVCVPDRFCECLGANAGEDCAQRTTDPFLNIPHFECNVAISGMGGALCQSDSEPIQLGEHFMGTDCGNKPLLSGPHLADLANAAPTRKFNAAELTLSHVDNGCRVQFKVSGNHDLAPEVGMVKIAGRSGALIFPLVLRFGPGPCLPKRLDCTFREDIPANDKIWACAAQR